jgi:REP element-mobilizing transposase RayT
MDLHPTIALSDLIKDIKVSSAIWLKNHNEFKSFSGWAEGYAALTLSYMDQDRVIEYIKMQKEHHKKESFIEEYRRLLIEAGIEFDLKYLQ